MAQVTLSKPCVFKCHRGREEEEEEEKKNSDLKLCEVRDGKRKKKSERKFNGIRQITQAVES